MIYIVLFYFKQNFISDDAKMDQGKVRQHLEINRSPLLRPMRFVVKLSSGSFKETTNTSRLNRIKKLQRKYKSANHHSTHTDDVKIKCVFHNIELG